MTKALIYFGLGKGAAILAGPIARASGVSLGIRIVGLALLFAQAVLAARWLGPSGYRTVAVVTSVVGILATFCQTGFGALAIHDIAARVAVSDVEGIRGFVRFSTRLVLLLSLAAGLILAALGQTGELVSQHQRETLALGAFLVTPVAPVGLFRGVSQGFGRVALAQAPGDLVRPAILVLAMVVAAALGLGFGPTGYMVSATGSAVVAAAVAWIWLWRGENARLSGPIGPSKRSGNQTVAALPFLGLGLTAMLQGELNALLLGSLAEPKDAGLFQPIVRLTPLMTLAVTAAGMRYVPRMSEFWQRGEIDRIRAVTRTFTWTTSLATLATALAICVSDPWLMWAFGTEFRESAPLLWHVAAAQIFNVACGPVGALLTMSGRSGAALAGQFSELLVNLTLGVLLIPNSGILGAVIAMIAGIVVSSFVMLRMTVSSLAFNPSINADFLKRTAS